MAVCSFIGHEDVYDADIESRLQLAVDEIVENHESVEFLIYPREKFYEVCLLAAMRARTHQPQKVTITLVIHKDGAQCANVPDCVIDKTVTLCFDLPKKDAATILRRKALRWIIQNSTHIITCIYSLLYDPDNRLPKKLPPLKIISLMSPETEAAILETVPFLAEQEQIAFQKISEGCMLKEAGQALGVSHERARQLLAQGSRTIRKYLRRRYHQALASKQRWGEHTCGIFALGEATDESLNRFKDVIDFLESTSGLRDIYVEQAYAQSNFIIALISSYQKLHITAMVSGKSLAADDGGLDDLETLLCPSCHAVGCVSWADSRSMSDGFDVIADIIERTDFCICDLSASPYAKGIRRYATQARQTILLDIGSAKSVCVEKLLSTQ